MNSLKDITSNWRNKPNRAVRVIGFGSSNTEQHWHSLGHFNWFSWLGCSLREWVGRHVTMINQGIGGETAEDLLKRIDRDVISFHPNLVIITIGGNDTWKGYTIEDYKKYLTQIVKTIKENNAIPVLQTYYCLLYNKMAKIFKIFPEFVDVNRNLSQEFNIPIIDQYKYFFPFYENDPENYSKIMLDGLHVNQIGNAIMGIIACRNFSLPDPIFLKDKKVVKKYMAMMKNYSGLPERISKRDL
ncbi:MAG: SGNH/GDSL hydrolase family protein [Candidatus Lokiarchaeota archaeon]|nr:SGNH/GDSL hydrolase family protein [Candidatus Lokiarchaeota archaeon]